MSAKKAMEKLEEDKEQLLNDNRQPKDYLKPEQAKSSRKRRRHRLQSDRFYRHMRPSRAVDAPPSGCTISDWKEMLSLTNEHAVGGLEKQVKSDGEHEKRDQDHYVLSGSVQNFTKSNSIGQGKLSRLQSTSNESLVKKTWIEEVFKRRECSTFIPTSKYPEKCGCGLFKRFHDSSALAARNPLTFEHKELRFNEKWCISKHTQVLPTDAYGTIEFQGGPHPFKANYMRLSFDTDPSNIMQLFEHIWEIAPPKLIITVHGGITNFSLQPKLARVFRKGLLKAAKTTGAWIITSGINSGVVQHVAASIEAAITGSKARSKIVSIGIAPWGLLKKRQDFVGNGKIVSYHPHSISPKGKLAVLNNRHSFFLLADNGTVGRYGADMLLRRRLESYIAEKQKIEYSNSGRSVPVVCVVLEGGACTVRTVLDYVNKIPPVPVVVCDGSGRASDLLSFTHQYVQEDGNLPEGIRPQLLNLVEAVFGYDKKKAQCLILDLLACVQQKHLITVFRLGEDPKQDVDYAILTALLKGHNLSPSEQLHYDWSTAALHNAMMEALMLNRVDFVRLLLENGVSMHSFLSITRLEELYNTDQGPPNTLYYIVRDVVKIRSGYRYKLIHIGLAIEKLMGYGYRSYYTSSEFRQKYSAYKSKRKHSHTQRTRLSSYGGFASIPLGDHFTHVNSLPSFGPLMTHSDSTYSQPPIAGSRALSHHIAWRFRRENGIPPTNHSPNRFFVKPKEVLIDVNDEPFELNDEDDSDEQEHFKYPFSDLLLWAVLTKRQDMALCMWEHGEEAMAKALVACRLYKSLAKEAAEDALEVEISDELKQYAEEFRTRSLDLLDFLYKHDDAQTLQLLTYELMYWSHETCLSLAVIVNNKQFLAHPCCQILLADLWNGGLRIRSNSNLRVVLGILFSPSIFWLEFKSREELMLQPQTAAEHEEQEKESSSESSSASSSESDSEEEPSAMSGIKDRLSSSENLHENHRSSLFPRKNRKAKNRSLRNTRDNNIASLHENVELQQLEIGSPVSQPSPLLPPIREETPKQNDRKQSYNENMTWPRGKTVDFSPKNEQDKKQDESSTKSLRLRSSPYLSQSSIFKKMPLPEGISFTRKKQIKFRRKLYEFFVAPITTFWAWSLNFLIFLTCFTYVLLIRTPLIPTWLELYLLSYVFVFGLEIIRRFFLSEPEKLSEKLAYFFVNYWNALTTMAIIMFLVGFAFRFSESTMHIGRCILAVNYVMWTVKLLDFLSVFPRFGPYIMMVGKMIINMTYIVIMLLISLLGFGLARQSITFPNENWHWLLVRNIFYKPYFMLYGEVYADEIDKCGDDAWDAHLENGFSLSEQNYTSSACVSGHWIPPLLMTFFLLISNILLISMLIAIFNNIFDATNKISQQIWLFQRYRQVMEYESTPSLVPPFTPLYYLFLLYKYIKYRRELLKNVLIQDKTSSKHRSPLFDYSLKLFLNNDQVEKLHDFEEECMENLAREKEYEKSRSSEERLHRTAERTDQILVRLNDLSTKEVALKGNIREMETRLELIESKQSEMLDHIRQLTSALPIIMGSLQSRMTSPQPMLEQTLRVDANVFIDGGSKEDRSTSPMCREKSPEVVASSSSRGNVHSTSSDVGLQFQGTPGPPRHSLSQPAESFSLPAVRYRTTTITGNELMKDSAPISTRLFGSLVSLDPSSLVVSAESHKNPHIKHRRRHDEYTSITDAISIEKIPILVQSTAPIVYVQPDEENNLHESMYSATYHEDEDDEEAVLLAKYGEHEPLGFNEEDATSDDSDRGMYTPNIELKRARASFVQRQNTLLKEHEETPDNQDSDVTHITDEENESNTEIGEEDQPIQIRLHSNEPINESETNP